jgi:tRNA (mo5U34)-methyltransferase
VENVPNPTLERNWADPQTDLEKQIVRLGPWLHNLHLPGGVQTAPGHPLGDFPAFKWRRLAPHLPADMTGMSVLDVGCNAGFYCFELARRGAHVLGIDSGLRCLEQARWAAERLDPDGRVEFRRMEAYELLTMRETFDIVLFLGVFYHLRYPLLALDLAAARARRMFIFQTLTLPDDSTCDCPDDLAFENRDRMLHPGWPRMAFIEKALQGDPAHWWSPNHSGVLALLRSSGFESIRSIEQEIYLCEDRREGLPHAHFETIERQTRFF